MNGSRPWPQTIGTMEQNTPPHGPSQSGPPESGTHVLPLCRSCMRPMKKAQRAHTLLVGNRKDLRPVRVNRLLMVSCEDHWCTFTYLEANGNIVQPAPRMRMSLAKLAHLEALGICRTNRSQMVNLRHVSRVVQEEQLYLHHMLNEPVAIGDAYADRVWEAMRHWNLWG